MAGAVAAEAARDSTSDHGITPFFPEWVVPLHPEGTGLPVFVFPSGHDGRASLVIEARVAGHVGRGRPFWGFRRDASSIDRARADWAAALGAECAMQMRAVQSAGPFLLYGNCFGGVLAWETARCLLEAGDEVAGILFYEVPLRSGHANVLPGPPPAHSANVWRLSHYYSVQPLPVHLTHVMTAGWRDGGWWKPWQEVALGSYETVVVPGETESAFDRREERIARHVRDWIATAERRVSIVASQN